MTGAEARIDETTSTRAISSMAVSRGEAAGREEHLERGGGTGSG
jgi:hypothetical protein